MGLGRKWIGMIPFLQKKKERNSFISRWKENQLNCRCFSREFWHNSVEKKNHQGSEYFLTFLRKPESDENFENHFKQGDFKNSRKCWFFIDTKRLEIFHDGENITKTTNFTTTKLKVLIASFREIVHLDTKVLLTFDKYLPFPNSKMRWC